MATPSFSFGGAGGTYSRIQRFNLHPNPKAAVDTSFMTSSVSSGAATLTRVATTGPIAAINTLFQNQISSGTPTSLDISNLATALAINNKATYNFSSYVRVNGSAVTSLSHYINWISNDGTTVLGTNQQTGISATSGTWQRIELNSSSIPSNAYFAIYTVRANSTTNFSVGNNIQTTGYLVEGS